MKIAVGQINSVIGDFSGNVKRILSYSREAADAGAEIIVFPELSVCGYPPMDLLDHPAFLQDNLKALRRLQHELPPETAVVVGYVEKNPGLKGKALQNTAAVIYGGRIVHRQEKTLLPTYDVFDEARYFEPAHSRTVWKFGHRKIGVAICEDMWWEDEDAGNLRYAVDPVQELLDEGAELILVPSASPFHAGKLNTRKKLIHNIGSSSRVPVVYANMCGANDNLIFDGRSLISDSHGDIHAMGEGFREQLLVDEIVENGRALDVSVDSYEEIEQALHLGISDYLKKTGFQRVHLGLSGGVDSALVLTLAVHALGKEKVEAFMLPSQYSSSGSISDSEKLCRNLGITPKTIAIEPLYNAFESSLAPHFEGTQPGLAEENIQARIRGTLLMAYSNKYASLVLTTGNKSELGVGYCTLYGDMAGSLAVIGDLFKTEVYALCRHINRNGEIIPEEIISKPPSAELRPDQKDQDSLPDYEILDGILKLYLHRGYTTRELIDMGFEQEVVQKVIGLVARSEYKRRQAPPVLKVSPKAFGTGRRIPIARNMYEQKLSRDI
ncbi:NAD+ synthase [Salinispira pacifica]|uniref:Glutamine-dependent NAD(+) synthetase n=1 Tax=Salinispira pacifica TaxID=1307761 RepID=V5WCG6_9SPIO|nr:NAD+ synthase [Salinispira pacifica]AHC13478.1 NAD synthetase/ Glutamine amidotransferase chain of NAD synthetase [Salinispira pacifica]